MECREGVYLGDIYQYLVKFTGHGDRLDMGGTREMAMMTPDLGFVCLIINQISYKCTTSSLKSLFAAVFLGLRPRTDLTRPRRKAL